MPARPTCSEPRSTSTRQRPAPHRTCRRRLSAATRRVRSPGARQPGGSAALRSRGGAASGRGPSAVGQREAGRVRSPGHPPAAGAAPRPDPPPPPAGPSADPCEAPAKSPRVTCASREAGCGAPGLVWMPAGHRVVLSGRAAASVGTRGSAAKAAGSRRTQAERTRAAMATPTQDALRRALRVSFRCRSSQERRCRAPPGAGGPWRPLAALRPAAARSNHPDVHAKGGEGQN